MTDSEWIEYLYQHKDLNDWDVACKKFYDSAMNVNYVSNMEL